MDDYATVPEITQQTPKWEPDLQFLSTFDEYNAVVKEARPSQLIIPDFAAQPVYTEQPEFIKRESHILDGASPWSAQDAQQRTPSVAGSLYAELGVDVGAGAVMPQARTADGELELDDDDDYEAGGNLSDSSEFEGMEDFREELNRLKESAGLQVPNSKVPVARGRRRQKQLSKMTTAERKIESINKREKARQSARDCRKRKKLYIHRLEQHVAKMKHRELAQTTEISRLKKRVLQLEGQLTLTLGSRGSFVAG